MQSVSLDILCLFPMSLNDDIIDIEKPYRIYLLTFVVDDFWYWLNSNIWCLQKTLQHYKNLYFHLLFYEIQVCFLFKTNEDNLNNNKHHFILTLLFLILLAILSLQRSDILLPLKSLQKWFVFYILSYVLKRRHDIFFQF